MKHKTWLNQIRTNIFRSDIIIFCPCISNIELQKYFKLETHSYGRKKLKTQTKMEWKSSIENVNRVNWEYPKKQPEMLYKKLQILFIIQKNKRLIKNCVRN